LYQGKSVEVRLFKGPSPTIEAKLTEPFGGYQDFKACVHANAGKACPECFCGALMHRLENTKDVVIADHTIKEAVRPLFKTQKKIAELSKKGYVKEMVDWSTYLTPGEPGYIHGEMLHPIISGNGVDYTAEELIPAVNTMIGKPIYYVPGSEMGPEHVVFPENLHLDPTKEVRGSTELARAKDGSINFLAKVDDHIYNLVKERKLPRGSIEADFMVKAQSDKNAAEFKPEFITFSGYLLLPEWAQPGDSLTKNQVFETVKKNWSCACPSGMAK